jgi:hypothetical protein
MIAVPGFLQIAAGSSSTLPNEIVSSSSLSLLLRANLLIFSAKLGGAVGWAARKRRAAKNGPKKQQIGRLKQEVTLRVLLRVCARRQRARGGKANDPYIHLSYYVDFLRRRIG